MALVANRQSFGIVAAAAADFAGDVNVRKKIHLDAAEAVALAGFATAAFDVEAEAARTVAALTGFGKHGEELANRRKHAGVGGGIRTRGAADRRLIDLDDFIDVLDTENHFVRARRLHGAVQLLRQSAVKNVVNERGFAGTGHAGDDGQQAEWNVDVDILEIVGAGAENVKSLS